MIRAFPLMVALLTPTAALAWKDLVYVPYEPMVFDPGWDTGVDDGGKGLPWDFGDDLVMADKSISPDTYEALMAGLLDGATDGWPGHVKPPKYQLWPGTNNIVTPFHPPFDLGLDAARRGQVLVTERFGEWTEDWVMYEPELVLTTGTFYLENLALATNPSLADVAAVFTDPAYKHLQFKFRYYTAPSSTAIGALPVANPPNIAGVYRFDLFRVDDETGIAAQVGTLYRQKSVVSGAPDKWIDAWVLYETYQVFGPGDLHLVPKVWGGESLRRFLEIEQVAFTAATRFVYTSSTVSDL